MQPELGPDGTARPHSEQVRINELLALAFRGDAGKAAMEYLRSISIERVCGPHATDAELRHLEGMRFIVGVISQRIAAHHKEQQHGGTVTVPTGSTVPRSRPVTRVGE
jgi:hypothetical protein